MNDPKVFASLIYCGSSFHSLGPAYLNELLHTCERLHCVIGSFPLVSDLMLIGSDQVDLIHLETTFIVISNSQFEFCGPFQKEIQHPLQPAEFSTLHYVWVAIPTQE